MILKHNFSQSHSVMNHMYILKFKYIQILVTLVTSDVTIGPLLRHSLPTLHIPPDLGIPTNGGKTTPISGGYPDLGVPRIGYAC